MRKKSESFPFSALRLPFFLIFALPFQSRSYETSYTISTITLGCCRGYTGSRDSQPHHPRQLARPYNMAGRGWPLLLHLHRSATYACERRPLQLEGGESLGHRQGGVERDALCGTPLLGTRCGDDRWSASALHHTLQQRKG